MLKADFYKEKYPLLLPFARFILNEASVGFDESWKSCERSWCKPLAGLCSVNCMDKKTRFCGFFLTQKTMLVNPGLFLVNTARFLLVFCFVFLPNSNLH